jgi:hypothetical protein
MPSERVLSDFRDYSATIAAIVLGILRIAGEKGEAFQAVAHLFVGGLFVAWAYTKNARYISVFWALVIVEVIAFLCHL